MAIDLKSFAKELAMQARDYIPADISDRDSKYIIETIYNFVVLSMEALEKEVFYELHYYDCQRLRKRRN